MNILHVIPYFAPAWAYGGPPRAAYELCRELVRRGHRITVATTDVYDAKRRAGPRDEMFEGLAVHRFRNVSNRLASSRQLFLPLGAATFTRRRIREFDIVHLHAYRTVQNLIVHHYGAKHRIPYVLSAHGTVLPIVRAQWAKAFFDNLYGRRVLLDAGRLVALTQAEKTQYESAGVPSDRISVVFNGVDTRAYEELPPPGSFRRSYGLEGKKLVVYVGRLSPRKGLVPLVQAFRQLSEHRGDVHLVLVGPDDGYKRLLEAHIKKQGLAERVTLTGLVAEPVKVQAYVDSDVVVYPSQHEIFGLVPFEALLCGKPVVVSDDSGCGEIIKTASAGVCVRYGDPVELQRALATCLDDGPDVRGMVLRGRRFVMEEMNWNKISGDMEKVYDEVVAKHRRT